ncbi:hypothetical protein [Streptomyces sp. NPDC002265]|uniref:hypothetical protein n=1 Tax=Streptomyces sp. NPDC002265 TaxID=3154415 RepID=UPI0033254149
MLRSARRPTGVESCWGRPESGLAACGNMALGDGLGKQLRWAATQVSDGSAEALPQMEPVGDL